MKINLDRIEARLKAFVESSSRLVSSKSGQEDSRNSRLAAAFSRFLEDITDSGVIDLPDSILIEIPVEEADEWKDFPFTETIQSILLDGNQTSPIKPGYTVVSNSSILNGEIIIRDAGQVAPTLDKTASMPALSQAEDDFLGDAFPSNAFLIVNGLDTVPLTKSVVNLGRKLENDLVIEDPRVSREHAQIRAIKGQYVIFDLNSTGGTFVNSVRISKQSLFPGDVISLAGVPLVYGQDAPTPFTRTGPVEPFFNPEKDKEEQ